MYYLIKFALKLIIVILLCAAASIFGLLELFFMFSQKKTYKFFESIDEIYYKNPKENGEEKEGSRILAKDCTILDWLKDNKNRYSLISHCTYASYDVC